MEGNILKKKIKLTIALLLSVALTGSLFTGCSSKSKPTSADDNKPVTITFWTQNEANYVKAAKDLIAKFQVQNPNIKVKIENFPDYSTKVNTAFSTRTDPDVLELYGSTISLAKGGKILPVPDSVMTKDEIEKTYYPTAIANRLYEGKYYGIAKELNMESPGLLVNVDLVKKAGLTIPDDWVKNDGPKTWSELIEFAKKLNVITKGTMKQAGLGVTGAQQESMFLSLIWQLGGDYRDATNNKVNFETEEAKKAVEFIKAVSNGPDKVDDNGMGSRMDGFKGNTIAMAIGAPWYAAEFDSNVKGLKYQYFNLPPFIDGANPNFVAEGGWGYTVSSHSKNPEASWKFVDFLSQKENHAQWAKTVGAISSRIDADTNFTYDPAIGSINKALSISQKINKYGNDPGSYTMDTVQLVWRIVRQNLKPMLLDEVTIDNGLKQMNKEANEMIKRNLER